MISIKIKNEPDENWNNRLLNSKNGTVIQTKEYARTQELQGIKPKFLTFYNTKDEIVAQLLAFETFKGKAKLAKFVGNSIFTLPFAKIASFFSKYLSWTFGPVILDYSYNSEISQYFGNFLQSEKLRFSGSIHPLETNFSFYNKFNFKKENIATFLIDLRENPENILQKTNKKSVRKNIERSQKRGVIIKPIKTDKDISTYGELLNQHRIKNKLTKYDTKLMVEGFRIVENVGQKGFLAWYEEQPVAGIVMSTFNGYINEWGIARSEIDQEQKLYSQDLLRWQIIEWGIKNKSNTYDLSGIKLKDRSLKEQGIFQNKKKWGGKLVQYSSFNNIT